MSEKVSLICIYGPKEINKFMSSCDMNDNGMKFFGTIETLSFKYKENEVVDDERIAVTIKKFIEASKDAPFQIVALFSPGKAIGAWRDKSIKMLSDGEGFIFLEEALPKLGFIE